MTATQKFIEDAIAGGYREDRTSWDRVRFEKTGIYHVVDPTIRIAWEEVLLDPLAWQAVGKTRGWTNVRVPDGHGGLEYNSPRHYMHLFIDHLADGKTLEEALSAIE